jgi:preprotein translocase subunit SecA
VSDVAIRGAAPAYPLHRQRIYLEQPERRESALDAIAVAAHAEFVAASGRRRAKSLNKILPLVERYAEQYRAMASEDIAAAVREVATALRRTTDFPDATTARAFALIRELSERILGKRHFDVQVVGAFAMIKGMLAEMATGEGKTLTATLVAGTAGLAGIPIHVITVNDYLVQRDAELMRPLYEKLGLTVGVVVAGQTAAQRRAAYACDITYCTNKELTFDYLRDRMLLGQSAGDLTLKMEALSTATPRAQQLRLRGLHFALIDEADSVLIDEGRTPLIISGTAESDINAEAVALALELARTFEADVDYLLSVEERRVFLTVHGQKRVTAFAEGRGRPWNSMITRDELAREALAALHLFKRGEQYVIANGKVQIVDEYTGRVMPDRFWSDGLHQMIEHKEGCEQSQRRTTIARITYQRFFRRYRRFAGMSGTLQPVARELWRVYRRKVVTIPTNKPVQRIHRPDVVVKTDAAKWKLIVDRVAALHARGVPVLIGTRSVVASERASEELDRAGLPHTVLNAAQDKHEAEVVALAGQRGRITVATNMAGRGTDIHLGDGIEELGGLHVIMTERHDARRIDLQLAGRAGRQGQPGSFEAILSLEDALLDFPTARALAYLAGTARGRWDDRLGRFASRYAQRRWERIHALMRHELLRSDQWQTKTLAISGRPE